MTTLSLILASIALIPGILPAAGQSARTMPAAADAADTSWAKLYATDCGAAMKHPCPPSTNGYENEFNGDPRLVPLLHRSLLQRESWWVNGDGGSAPVSAIVQEFIGVPNDMFVDDDRYVTATGCVPHYCVDGGMLWIDTVAKPATVIFAAAVDVRSNQVNGPKHVWIYTNSEENTLSLPPNFLKHLASWYQADINPQESALAALATLVQPNGRMTDFIYKALLEQLNPLNSKQNAPGAKQ